MSPNRLVQAALPSGIWLTILLLFNFLMFRVMYLPMDVFQIILQMMLVIWVVYLFFHYFHLKKQASKEAHIAMLTKELEDVRQEQIVRNQDLQSYFLTWVHQVKTPLSAAKLLAEEAQNTDIRRELISIEQYTNMAMSYLKLMDLDQDLDITLVPIDDLLRKLFRQYSILFIHNGIMLNFKESGGKVRSDGQWLKILVELILSNAIKYTPKGQITVGYHEPSRTLDISDNGMGIQPEDLPRIFHRGYSGFNGRLNEKSSGLGLYLAQNIAQRLNIKITVQSTPGQGSTFSLHFPKEALDF